MCVHLDSVQDNVGWTPANRHDDRAGGYGRSSQDSRSRPHNGHSRYDSRGDRKEGSPERQRDNGWETRRQSTTGQSWDDPRGWSSNHGESSNREDRAWEPAASWQPARREAGSSSNPHQRYQNSGKSKNKNKGSKKGGNKQQQQSQQQLQQKRSWRDDDSQLNKCVLSSGYLPSDLRHSVVGHVASLAPRRKAYRRRQANVDIIALSPLVALAHQLNQITLVAHTAADPARLIHQNVVVEMTVPIAVVEVRATLTGSAVITGVTGAIRGPHRHHQGAQVVGDEAEGENIRRRVTVAVAVVVAVLRKAPKIVPRRYTGCRLQRPSRKFPCLHPNSATVRIGKGRTKMRTESLPTCVGSSCPVSWLFTRLMTALSVLFSSQSP